jgi:SAM-dependent methyltransferase
MTLRETFEEAPELYDRVRPDYPDELFDDLARLVGLLPGSRVLELGCGTGQATVSLARRGYEVVAVELGAGLANVARKKLAPFAAVRVVNAVFEAWPLPAEPFDLVFAATSFHWIDRAVRVTKSADALRPGGALAVTSSSSPTRSAATNAGTPKRHPAVLSCRPPPTFPAIVRSSMQAGASVGWRCGATSAS